MSKRPLADPRFGPQPPRGSALMRRCRLLQSRYRVEVLKEEACGPWSPGGACVGSSLVGGEVSGSNFISPAAFDYARQKVEEKTRTPDLTINPYRLFNNMLSSMPMCFNLFADLRAAHIAGNPATTHAVQRMFPEARITRLDRIEVEMIPLPTRDYIDDKTAFDAAILFRDSSGRLGLVSIETKYTDHLGGNRAARQDRKQQLAERLRLFTEEGRRYFAAHGFDQLARNVLLTLAYEQKHDCAVAINYVLSLKCDAEAPNAVSALCARLAPQYRDRIRCLSLEDVVSRGLEDAPLDIAQPLRRFSARYLDFSPLAAKFS